MVVDVICHQHRLQCLCCRSVQTSECATLLPSGLDTAAVPSTSTPGTPRVPALAAADPGHSLDTLLLPLHVRLSQQTCALSWSQLRAKHRCNKVDFARAQPGSVPEHQPLGL